MDPTTGGANAMRLAPDYEPPTRSRHDGAHGRGDANDDTPAGPMDANAEMPGTETMGGATMGDMPRGEMQVDPPEVRNRLVGMMEGDAGADEMPTAGSAGGAAFPTSTMPAVSASTGSMPTGAMTGGGMDASSAAAPGADGMPAGTMRDANDGAKPGETTPTRATLEGAVGGLTIRGEWRLTLSSVSTGSGG